MSNVFAINNLHALCIWSILFSNHFLDFMKILDSENVALSIYKFIIYIEPQNNVSYGNSDTTNVILWLTRKANLPCLKI